MVVHGLGITHKRPLLTPRQEPNRMHERSLYLGLTRMTWYLAGSVSRPQNALESSPLIIFLLDEETDIWYVIGSLDDRIPNEPSLESIVIPIIFLYLLRLGGRVLALPTNNCIKISTKISVY